MSIKTGKELAAAAEAVAKNHETLYVLGCIGDPLSAKNKERYIKKNDFNSKLSRKLKISAAEDGTFGFDCSCLIKALLWGWEGDKSKTYGGAVYKSNGVPDTNANGLIKACSDVSTDFSRIRVGEVVWIEGHIGVYLGDGLAVECTHRWADGVQITAVHNIGTKAGYKGRNWTKHGKLPYISYETTEEVYEVEMPVLKKGAKGAHVKALQILLIGYGYNCGKTGADGDFGSNTQKAVKAFQKANGFKQDGIVGPITGAKLLGL